jgi:hypothetical protein
MIFLKISARRLPTVDCAVIRIKRDAMFQHLIDLPQWAHRLIAILLIVAGATTVAWGTMNLIDSYTSQNWPVAIGTVIDSKVTRHHVRRGRFSRRMVYRPEVAYSYRVAGHEYHGDRLAFNKSDYASEADAHAIAGRYRPLDQLSVRYKPSDPSCCVITPGVTNGSFAIPGIGIALLMVGILLGVGSGLCRRRSAASEEELYAQEAASWQRAPKYSS